jgi:hypothetical protein
MCLTLSATFWFPPRRYASPSEPEADDDPVRTRQPMHSDRVRQRI